MNLTTKQIAEEINGTIDGNSEIKISQLSKIEEGGKGSPAASAVAPHRTCSFRIG